MSPKSKKLADNIGAGIGLVFVSFCLLIAVIRFALVTKTPGVIPKSSSPIFLAQASASPCQIAVFMA